MFRQKTAGTFAALVLLILAALVAAESQQEKQYALKISEKLNASKELQKNWLNFRARFNRKYATNKEEFERMQIFADNLKMIRKHNELANRGLSTYRMGVNNFADMTHKEFLAKKTGLSLEAMNASKPRRGGVRHASQGNQKYTPNSYDWRKIGHVTRVKDQLQCNNGYIFAAVGSMEFQYWSMTGYAAVFSEQQLLDCSFNHGCYGGLLELSYAYAEIYGIQAEMNYPSYNGRKGLCRYDPTDASEHVNAYFDATQVIEPGSEVELKKAVANVGPVTVYFDPSGLALYESGIYYNPSCCSRLSCLSHAMLVVGYGSENGNDYWLVKNSWNTWWGEQGYMRVARNRNNHCGIASVGIFATLDGQSHSGVDTQDLNKTYYYPYKNARSTNARSTNARSTNAAVSSWTSASWWLTAAALVVVATAGW